MTRLGWFGGSFNPPHLGHLVMAQQLVQKLKFDHIYFMPTNYNANKRSINSKHRVAMLERLIEASDFPFSIDKREIEREGISYTIDSLKDIALQHPHAQRNFILGADAFANLHKWKDYSHLCDYANLVVLDRSDTSLVQSPHTKQQWQEMNNGAILFAPITRYDCSSTDIRKALCTGNSAQVRQMLPPVVANYIHSEKLYQNS